MSQNLPPMVATTPTDGALYTAKITPLYQQELNVFTIEGRSHVSVYSASVVNGVYFRLYADGLGPRQLVQESYGPNEGGIVLSHTGAAQRWIVTATGQVAGLAPLPMWAVAKTGTVTESHIQSTLGMGISLPLSMRKQRQFIANVGTGWAFPYVYDPVTAVQLKGTFLRRCAGSILTANPRWIQLCSADDSPLTPTPNITVISRQYVNPPNGTFSWDFMDPHHDAPWRDGYFVDKFLCLIATTDPLDPVSVDAGCIFDYIVEMG